MIQDLLKELGCSEKEVEIYSALLEQGKTTPARLSKSTNINRSTVYAVLGQLKEKGLVIEDISSKILFYSISSPDSVEDMFYSKQEEINKKKRVAEKLAEELEKLPKSTKYVVPKLKFIEHDELEEYLYKNQKKWVENAEFIDNACWGFQDHSFAENYQKWIDWAMKNYNLNVNLLSNEAEIENKMAKIFEKRRDIRPWSQDLDFTSSLWIMGDYIVMAITRQKPHYLVEINDAVLAHNLREVFKKIWKDVKGDGKKTMLA